MRICINVGVQAQMCEHALPMLACGHADVGVHAHTQDISARRWWTIYLYKCVCVRTVLHMCACACVHACVSVQVQAPFCIGTSMSAHECAGVDPPSTCKHASASIVLQLEPALIMSRCQAGARGSASQLPWGSVRPAAMAPGLPARPARDRRRIHQCRPPLGRQQSTSARWKPATTRRS